MNKRGNERGAALVIVLILAAVALVASAGIMYMVAKGSFLMGQQKRYHSALEAAKGGRESMIKVIMDRGLDNAVWPNPTSDFHVDYFSPSMNLKLSQSTEDWGGLDTSLAIDPADSATYDLSFRQGQYRFYGKIVDTVQGNTGRDEGLIKAGVAHSGEGEVTVMAMPFLYSIEVLAQSEANAAERARVSVLYEY